MKKVFLFLSLWATLHSFGQCVISGPGTVQVGQTVTYSVPSTLAQCAQCYDWDVSGGAAIVGDDTGSSVSVQGTTAGTFNLSITYFDETGCHTCTGLGNGSGGTVVPAGANCCAPIVTFSYICRGNGLSAGGQLKIKKPANCNVDWSQVQKIFIGLDANTTFTPASFLAGQNSGYIYPPFTFNSSGEITAATYTTNCPFAMNVYIQTYYNNGCPVAYADATYFSTTPPPFPRTANSVKVSPNPTRSGVRFEGGDLSGFLVSVYDEKGETVVKDADASQAVSLEKQQKGIYIYKLQGPDGYAQEGKIIRE